MLLLFIIYFQLGWFSNPIYSKNGDYPSIIKNKLAIYSISIGAEWSVLPVFTKKQVRYIKGSADFFGLNHYSTLMAKSLDMSNFFQASPLEQIIGGEVYPDPKWPSSASSWLKVS